MRQHEQSPGLTFGEYGYSLCYLVTPFQSVEGPAREFRAAFDHASSEYELTSDPPRDTSGFTFETYVMTGLCDVLFVVRHDNFRFIHYLQNQLETVVATSASWFHVLPYSSHTSAAPPNYNDGILFQVYIKSSLLPYRNPETSPLKCGKSLAHELLALITRANSYGFQLGLYTTIGWADCLLWGSFSGNAADHWRFFQELERIGYTVGDEYHAFYQKRILLTGIPVTFDGDGKPRLPSYSGSKSAFSPLLLGRSKPGSVHNAAVELREYAGRMVSASTADSDILLLDGKWDLLWSLADERVALEEISSAVAHFATTDAVPKYIERLETHLLPSPVSGESDTPVVLWSFKKGETFRRSPKGYLKGRINKTWVRVRELPIASPLVNEIATHLSLFTSIMEDNDNRFIADYVMHGAIDALQEIVYHLEYTGDILAKGQDQLVDQLYSDLQSYLKNWCEFAAEGIRQRVSGSFENLFERPLNAPAFRGTIQKMLFVMDGLLREFYGMLPADLTRNERNTGYERPPRLASIFTPTTLICSQRYLELVEIPSRYSFSPHLVLPQLWHEVGQCVFFRKFGPFTSKLLSTLALQHPNDYQYLYRLIGDHFSDLLVLYYGFSGRFDVFSKYLVKSIILSQRELVVIKDAQINKTRRDRLLRDISARLLVLERFTDGPIPYRGAAERAAYVVDRARMFFSDLFDDEVDLTKAPVDYVVEETLREHVDEALQVIVAEDRHKNAGIRYLSQEDHREIFAALAAGTIHDLSDEMLVNEIFLPYYEASLLGSRAQSGTFRELAALGFSALQKLRGRDPAFERAVKIRNNRSKGTT